MTAGLYESAMSVVRGLGGELSPPSIVIAGAAFDAATPLLAQGAEVAAEALGQVVGAAVTEIASAIPAVGFVVGVVSAVIKIVGSTAGQREAERRAECQLEFQQRKVRPSGSKLGGCESCPCDLFRLVDGERSLVGEALVRVTEGRWLDVPDDQVVDHLTRMTARQFNERRHALVAKAAGTTLTLSRRSRYAALRRAMESAYVEPGGPSSDGGLSLWPPYLDMLLTDIDRGTITKRYIDLAISAAFVPAHLVTDAERVLAVTRSRDGVLIAATIQRSCYVPGLSQSVLELADGWRNTVRPRYDEGKRVLRELEEIARSSRRMRGSLAFDLAPRSRWWIAPVVAAGAFAAVKPSAAGSAMRALSAFARAKMS